MQTKKRNRRAAKTAKRLAMTSKPALMTTAPEVVDRLPKSLPRLSKILREYYQPVVNYEAIGNRVPFKTLTRRINEGWNLTGDNRFLDGEINATTVVIDLARDIDSRADIETAGKDSS